MTNPFRGLRAILPCVPVLLGGACKGAEPEPERPAAVARPGSATLPWTRAFQNEAVLLADQITIEGPNDLSAHVALRREPHLIDFTTETTREGLRQVAVRKQTGELIEIRAQLDNWNLVAFQKIVILQRPGDAPVRIIAQGNVAFIPADGGDELRRDRIEFRGDRPASP